MGPDGYNLYWRLMESRWVSAAEYELFPSIENVKAITRKKNPTITAFLSKFMTCVSIKKLTRIFLISNRAIQTRSNISQDIIISWVGFWLLRRERERQDEGGREKSIVLFFLLKKKQTDIGIRSGCKLWSVSVSPTWFF